MNKPPHFIPKLAGLVFLSLLILGGCLVILSQQHTRKAARLIRELKATGAPLTTKEVAQNYEGKGNAAVARTYHELFALLPPGESNRSWHIETPAELASRLPHRPLTYEIFALDERLAPVAIDKLQTFVRLNEAFYELAEKLTNAGAASFEYDWRLPFKGNAPHLEQIYAMATVIAARSYLNIELGKRDAAIKDIQLLFQIPGALKNDPLTRGHGIRHAIVRRALNCLNRLICQLELTPDQLRTLLELPNASPTKEEVTFALQCERACGLDRLGEAPASGKKRRAWNYNQWVYLSTFQRMLSAIHRPDHEAVKLLAILREDFEARSRPVRPSFLRYVLMFERSQLKDSVLMLSDFFGDWEALLETMARESLARIAIAIEIHRLQHGALPTDLSSLAMEEWRDPFTNEQMRFRVLPNKDQWIIYSFGENQTDDAGEGIHISAGRRWVDGRDVVFPVSSINRR